MIRRRLRAALVASLIALAASSASAYEGVFTHRFLARAAVEHLVRTHPGQGYDEARTFIDAIVEGALHEDDIFLDGDENPQTLRVMRHFYRPTDEKGLEMYGIQFPNSYQWGVEPRADNEWGWDDAVEQYRRGNLYEAYFALGHVVHLVEDATVPAHTHLDIHGPPIGDNYEQHCFHAMNDARSSTLPGLPAGTPVPHYASLKQLWQKTANASYWRNMYPGDLSSRDAARGLVAKIFPDLSYSYVTKVWRIAEPKVGALDDGFFEDQPGWYYFKNTAQVPSEDRVNFALDAPREVSVGPNDDAAPMTALLARDLIPVAILQSAAVVRLFMEQRPSITPETASPEAALPPPSCAAAGGSLWMVVGLALLRRQRRRS